MSVRLAVSGSNLSGDVPFSAALVTEHNVYERRSPAGERGDLAMLCRELCDEGGVAPADVTEVLLDVGPGSYTGLRVAVTFVRFLQAFGDVQVRAVDSLAWLCRVALPDDRIGPVRALLDGRRGRYLSASMFFDGEGLVEREASAALPVEVAIERITTGDVVALPAGLAGDIGDAVRERGAELRVVRELTARSLLLSGLPWAAAGEGLEPRYLMASYAEAPSTES